MNKTGKSIIVELKRVQHRFIIQFCRKKVLKLLGASSIEYLNECLALIFITLLLFKFM